MYSSLRFFNLVIYPIKNDKEVLSDKDIFLKKKLLVFKAQKNLKEVNKVLKVETEIATDSIIVNS
jgi:hypothetical protein